MPKTNFNYKLAFDKIRLLKRQNRDSINTIRKVREEGGRLRDGDIQGLDWSIKSNLRAINDERRGIVENMRRLPAFRSDKRFKNLSYEEREKMQRFYESMHEEKDFMDKIPFEDHCQITVDNYDGAMIFFGDSFPKSYTEGQKLSALFVNKGLHKVWDETTQSEVEVNVDNLRICSYPQQDLDGFNTQSILDENTEIIDARGLGGETSILDMFFKTISIRPKVMAMTKEFVNNKIANNPEAGRVQLTKEEVQEITKNITDLGLVDLKKFPTMEGHIFEQVAVCSVACGKTPKDVIVAGAEMRNTYNLPHEDTFIQEISVDGRKYWLTDEGALTNQQLDEKYETNVVDDQAVVSDYLAWG